MRDKISQLFIAGFEGEKIDNDFKNLLENGIGGVIFFADNFSSTEQAKKLISEIKTIAKIPPFLSIDQEGGLVERTIKMTDNTEYLSPMALAQIPEEIEAHTKFILDELNYLGINMNFAPTMDVNTEHKNPVIGLRAFSEEADRVIEYSKIIYKTHQKNGIIPVAKHFLGHGSTKIDSHLDLPTVGLDIKELERTHIKPFKEAIKDNIEAIMVSHVNYKAFNKTTPASLSKEVLGYLRKTLGFKGLIISDDMAMGAVAKHYDPKEAVLKGLQNGIDMFIFKTLDPSVISYVEHAVKQGLISKERIDEATRRVFKLKEKYNLAKKKGAKRLEANQSAINKMAKKALKILGKPEIKKDETVLVLSYDFSKVYNFNFNELNFAQIIGADELIYTKSSKLSEITKNYDKTIFISYNALINDYQKELFNEITGEKILVLAGTPYDLEVINAKNAMISYGWKTPNIKAIADFLKRA